MGLNLAARIRERAPDTPCVLFTNEGPDCIETEQRERVAVEYLPKGTPEARSSLVRLVENVVAQRIQVGYPLPPDENERLTELADLRRFADETMEQLELRRRLAEDEETTDTQPDRGGTRSPESDSPTGRGRS